MEAGRVSRYVLSSKPAARNRFAEYEHITRIIRIVPGLSPQVLRRAVTHELVHAVDDNFGVMHYFSESPEWVEMSRRLSLGEDSVETFSEHMVVHLQDPVRHRKAHPLVAAFMDRALNHLKTHFN